jgi:hypothetical protein
MLLLEAFVRDTPHDLEPAAAASDGPPPASPQHDSLQSHAAASTAIISLAADFLPDLQPISASNNADFAEARSSESERPHSSAGADDPASRRAAALPTESILAALPEDERPAAAEALVAAARLAVQLTPPHPPAPPPRPLLSPAVQSLYIYIYMFINIFLSSYFCNMNINMYIDIAVLRYSTQLPPSPILVA